MKSAFIGGGRIAAALSAALALIGPAPARAGSFRVDPVHIVLEADRAGAELRLTNVEAAPAGMRVSVFRWTQSGGQDVYEPADDIIASPPIFTVQPGATQVVRFGIRRRIPGAAYRIHVAEIPREGTPSTGIRVALKLDLPLHVSAARAAPAALSWSLRRNADGRLVAEGRNEGGTHAQVSGIALVDSAGRHVARSAARGTILPGSMRAWTLGADAGAGAEAAATIVVTTASGEQRSAIGAPRP